MNISTTWLREWVNPSVSDEALAEKLTMVGLEVGGIAPVAPYFEGVVVGQVVSCEKHPDADKLSLCQVNIGQSDNLQIICGAPNVRLDLKVVVATVGSKLPNGLKIKKAKLRGVESFGMLCSETELGISDSHDGIMELSADAPLGESIRIHLDLDDQIIELDITPNRGDCFSVLGVAREVCASYDLTMPSPSFKADEKDNADFATKVSNAKACPKYLTRVIKGINNTVETPQWMAQKLKRASQQTHSPVVDITNYVLLELGQPMHAFDLQKIGGGINVRMAKKGEELELLNEQTVSLREDTLVIADDHSAIAMAGVMGGMSTATQVESCEILFESAFFEPVLMAGVARSYGLHTESSLRFERGVDFNLPHLALERATQLVLEICGGEASPINECIDEAQLPHIEPITITLEKISKVLGFELESDWIEAKFKSLDFDIVEKMDSSWTIVPPSYRFDIRIVADLIEELARLYGYDRLPVKSLTLDANITGASQASIDAYDLSQVLVNKGYQEAITYSFISSEYQSLIDPEARKIELTNPISEDMSVMRSSLWSGLLQTIGSNLRRGHNNARFFESGLCFGGISADDQIQKIAGAITGQRYSAQWASESKLVDFFDVKADVESLLALSGVKVSFEVAEHPALQNGQTAKIVKNGKTIGYLGALSPIVQKKLSLPKVFLFELVLSELQQGAIASYKAFSSFQASQRDIALVLSKDIQSSDLISAITSLDQEYLIDVNIFDVYEGEHIEAGKKSVALNLSYQSSEATLTDEQLNQSVDEILSHLQTEFSAHLR
jgi:phenylalanyl-tRNA synthetase beta chain